MSQFHQGAYVSGQAGHGPLNWGPCGKSLSSSTDAKGRLSCWQLGHPPPPLWSSAGPRTRGWKETWGGSRMACACPQKPLCGYGSTRRVAEGLSWSPLCVRTSLARPGLSQNGAWMLNCVPSADAEQMTERIKEVPACPQPASTVCGWRTTWPGGEA